MTTLAFQCCIGSQETFKVEEEKLAKRDERREEEKRVKMEEVRKKLVDKVKKEM